MKISSIGARQIFDSRGHPTVEATVWLDDGSWGRAAVPSGASTGRHEALELRDGHPGRYRGRSVHRAIENVHGEISRAVKGRDAADQEGLDEALIALDGTHNKGRLGANAILGVSMAAAQAAASAQGIPLFEHLGHGKGTLLPLPEIQIFGGGAHADRRVDMQDYMIVAMSARTYEEALEVTHNVFHAAGELLRGMGALAGIADEGGYWPSFIRNEDGLDLLTRAIESAGYAPGRDVSLSLDIAATELHRDGLYEFGPDRRRFTSAEFTQLMLDWVERYPIVSLEDPLAEDDWEGWRALRRALGNRCQLIGDDLFVTNLARIERGIEDGAANSVLIKLNQVGTVTETLRAIRRTQEAGWLPVVSARSGETEDTFIAHLAVATNAGQLKVGSFSRSERMAKWNEVLRIQDHLGARARYVGAAIYGQAGIKSAANGT